MADLVKQVGSALTALSELSISFATAGYSGDSSERFRLRTEGVSDDCRYPNSRPDMGSNSATDRLGWQPPAAAQYGALRTARSPPKWDLPDST